MIKFGITIGKFMPLHAGHELMIEFGASMVDLFYVIVSGKETDTIPLTVRYDWVWDYVNKNNLTNVEVVYHIDNSPTPINVDEHGTVLDPEFQNYWKSEFRNIMPHATHFVSSDRYGQTMADLLGIEWIPVDPLREMVNISATKIRNNIDKNFKYISDVAKPYFVKKIAVIGPESSGKSTMTKILAEEYNGIIVNEYGRTLSEVKTNDLSKDDFLQIMKGQQVLIDIAVKKSTSPYVFIDTEAYVTYLFSKIYLGEYVEEILEFGKTQNIDHYIVLAPTVKWVDDGTRVLGDQEKREEFYKNLVDILEKHSKSYACIESDSYNERVWDARDEVEYVRFVSKYKPQKVE